MAPPESKSNRLPFEPASNRKKADKVSTGSDTTRSKPLQSGSSSSSASAGIPQVVSQRMGRRMAFFCGIPTTLGMLTFIGSYWVVTHDWIELPSVVTLLVSLGFFGLGVIGLSYGALSASWDEERVGGYLGWQEFTANLGRTTKAWQEAKQTDQTKS
jgi:hypothetical protein